MNYNWITKKRMRGVSLFQKVVREMERVEEEILAVRAGVLNERDRLAQEMSENAEALEFLAQEERMAQQTKEKVRALC